MRSKVDKKTVSEELRKLRDRNGRITPNKVIDAAKDPKHRLHHCFTWDDAVAGDKWRIEEARSLIAWCELEVRIEETTYKVAEYVRDPGVMPGWQGYRATESVRQNKADARAVMVEECERAAAHLRRARDLAQVLGKSDAVEPLVRQLDKLRHSLAA